MRISNEGTSEEPKELAKNNSSLDIAGLGLREGIKRAVDLGVDLGDGLGCEKEEAVRKGGEESEEEDHRLGDEEDERAEYVGPQE